MKYFRRFWERLCNDEHMHPGDFLLIAAVLFVVVWVIAGHLSE